MSRIPIDVIINSTDGTPLNVVGGKLQVDIGGATVTGTFGSFQASTVGVTLQNAATASGAGTPFTVNAYKTLVIEISGTSASRTINFEAAGPGGTYYAIQGTRLSDLSMATNTTTTGELWQFDITGITSIRANITSVSGGNVTVQGTAVA